MISIHKDVYFNYRRLKGPAFRRKRMDLIGHKETKMRSDSVNDIKSLHYLKAYRTLSSSNIYK